ncbi:dickkopf WNT signaling pathway inhibitor 1a [Brachyhypopomus gauderio]|uniref:dickkopf WNT signaling pathway inhibitor 1a n=1 Tax=Brachyhypopomus gauderio TaxID=698409 RepID=UPI0040413D19
MYKAHVSLLLTGHESPRDNLKFTRGDLFTDTDLLLLFITDSWSGCDTLKVFPTEDKNMMPVSLTAIAAVYLAVLGGSVRDVRAGSGLRNSIKNLPNEGASPTAVSAGPRVVQSDSGGIHKGGADTPVPLSCAVDGECGAAKFCNEARRTCVPCRRRRKRCLRHAMCCGGNPCINGVCQAAEMNSTQSFRTTAATQLLSRSHATAAPVTRSQNRTVLSRQPKGTTVSSQQMLKGGEGDMCLRSSDCSDGLCCARHFWSRICKPVLSEGQMCTRHRRKDTHGLEIFQRCDCGQGLVCRALRDRPGGQERQQQHGGSSNNNNRAARNLHTCQQR